MNNIIFTKYSNQRDDKYKIKTVIWESESGKKIVGKFALTDAALAHIENKTRVDFI